MNRIACTALALGVLLLATGCAHNAIVAHDSTRVGVFFGDLGIKGDRNNVTVQPGSRLTKMSFWGNDNTVAIEDDVTLPQVEFFGLNNTISIPQHLMIRLTEVGEGNKVVRRPVKYGAPAPRGAYYPAPATSTTTPPALPEPGVSAEETPSEQDAEEQPDAGESPAEPGW